MPLAQSHSYTLHLPAFEGPLDVLLRLIEKNELEITAISVTQVADQYLDYVRGLQTPQPSAMAEFLALAAQLVLIKSRSLLPRPEPENGLNEADSAEQLARQLREYQQIKHAVEHFREWEDTGRRSWERLAPPPQPEIERPSLPPQTIDGLLRAIQRRLELTKPTAAPSIPIPRPKTITIADVTTRLWERLAQQPYCTFEDMLDLAPCKADIIVTLWTVLEQFKRHYISIEQPELYEMITIGRGPAWEQRPIQFTDSELAG